MMRIDVGYSSVPALSCGRGELRLLTGKCCNRKNDQETVKLFHQVGFREDITAVGEGWQSLG